jgi:hypothetical protein
LLWCVLYTRACAYVKFVFILFPHFVSRFSFLAVVEGQAPYSPTKGAPWLLRIQTLLNRVHVPLKGQHADEESLGLILIRPLILQHRMATHQQPRSIDVRYTNAKSTIIWTISTPILFIVFLIHSTRAKKHGEQ